MAKPVLQILINDNDFLCEQHYKKTVSKLVKPEDKDFNFDKISCKDKNAGYVVQCCKTSPFMGDFRTVVVEDFEKYGKPDLDVLAKYFEDPSPFTNVIVLTKKLDKRSKFYKVVSKKVEILEFKKLYVNQVPPYVKQMAQEMNVKLEIGVAELLTEAFGTDLQLIRAELEKLYLALPEGQPTITKSILKSMTAFSVVDNVFQLVHFLGERKLSEATFLFHQLIAQGEAVPRLLSMVGNHFRKLLLAKEALSSGGISLERLLGVPAFFVKDYQKQSKFFTISELKMIYGNLLTLTEETRSIKMSPVVLFEDFIQKVCLQKVVQAV